MEMRIFKKIILILFFMLFLVGCEKDEEQSLIIEPARSYCLLDDIDEKKDFSFKVRNPTNKTIKIEKIKTSCSCLDTEISSSILLPRESAILTASISQSRYGANSNWIILKTDEAVIDDADRDFYKIDIITEVLPKVFLIPARINQKKYEGMSDEEFNVKVNIFDKSKISKVYADSDWIKINNIEVTDRGYVINGIFETKKMESGLYNADIIIEMSNDPLDIIKVPTTFEVLSNIEIKPETLFLGYIRPEYALSTRSVKISINNISPDSLDLAVQPTELLAYEILKKETYSEIVIKIKDLSYRGVIKGGIQIKSVNDINKEIFVPITGLIENN